MSDLVQRLRDSMRTFRTDELCREAADELERLTRELEEARKDQARYRWLRHGDNDEQMLRFSACGRCGTDNVWVLREDALDAAIDAAMSQEKRKDALDRMARDADELGLDY